MFKSAALSSLALIALAGTTAGAQVIDWALPVNGDWGNSANWVGGNVPDTASEHAVLGLVGPYTVNIDTLLTVGSLLISNPLATLELPNARLITLNGPLTNNGTVLLNSNQINSNSGSLIVCAVDTIIDGNGVIDMYRAPGGQWGAQLFASSGVTATIGANQIVQGSGHIYGDTSSIFVNNGLVTATDPLAKLDLVGTFIGGTGVYMADGGTLNLAMTNGSNTPPTFTNVTFDTANGGQIIPEWSSGSPISRAPRFDGVTNLGMLSIPNDHAIRLDGPLTNNGTVLVSSDGGISGRTSYLYFQNSTTIDGIGTIELNATAAIARTRIETAPDVIATFGPGQTIQGAGSIASTSTGSIVNNGTILPGGDLREISLSGNMTLTPTSHLIFDLGGSAIGEYDRMPITGSSNIALDGTLTVNIDDGYEPVFGDLWEIIDGGNHTGEFAQVNSPNAPLGLIFKAVYEANRMYVVLTCEADLNSDGALDFFDVSAFLAAYSSGDLMADFTGDGQLNFFDVSVFLSIFSAGCP